MTESSALTSDKLTDTLVFCLRNFAITMTPYGRQLIDLVARSEEARVNLLALGFTEDDIDVLQRWTTMFCKEGMIYARQILGYSGLPPGDVTIFILGTDPERIAYQVMKFPSAFDWAAHVQNPETRADADRMRAFLLDRLPAWMTNTAP